MNVSLMPNLKDKGESHFQHSHLAKYVQRVTERTGLSQSNPSIWFSPVSYGTCYIIKMKDDDDNDPKLQLKNTKKSRLEKIATQLIQALFAKLAS